MKYYNINLILVKSLFTFDSKKIIKKTKKFLDVKIGKMMYLPRIAHNLVERLWIIKKVPGLTSVSN